MKKIFLSVAIVAVSSALAISSTAAFPASVSAGESSVVAESSSAAGNSSAAEGPAVGKPASNVSLSNLKFGSYKISRISPRSFRSVDGSAQIVCTNKDCTFTMSNITGTVYKKGVPFVKGYASPVTVPAGQSTVTVDGNASLCDGIGLWDVLACLAFKASDYTIDVSMTISAADGRARQYSRTGISVANLLHNVRGK